ncbi:MAG TPA: phosphate ABC transporter permease subunit PstC [Nitrososphaerales archaeon]|nr:phosphate ABC transporter permease subunit PstC [Nitrososphaerales archaeon]
MVKSARGIRDTAYKYATALLGSSAFVFIFVIAAVLIIFSYPSIVVYGRSFLTTIVWNPALSSNLIQVHGFPAMSGASYGVLVFLAGTLISSVLALLIGVPAGLGISIFLAQVAPKKVAGPVSFLTELLAGIPSVIYGFWGILVLGPFLLYTLEPALAHYLSFMPWFSGPVYSSGMLASGVILALMIVPIIASISRDAMLQTPESLKDGGRALGLTDWEIMRKIIIPYSKSGIVGSIVLGLGRALGETMAVAMVSGASVNILPKTFFYPINTMAAFMVLNMDSAFTDPSAMFVHALVEMAAILLLITMAVNIIARARVRHGFVSSSEGLVRV